MKTKRLSISWKRKKKGVLLIELSEHLLKVFQRVEEGSKKRVIYLGHEELHTQDEKAVSKQLTTLLKRFPEITGPCFASLPRAQMTTRILLLPSTNPQELAKMVEYQIEKEIPFPKEKIIFDHQVIETTPEGYTRVLLAIAGEEVVHRYLNILKGAGQVPTSLFLSSQGLASWFNRTKGEKEKEEFCALIDIDLFLTHIEVLHQGELYYTRSFSAGARQIKEKGEGFIQETFLQELHRTFVAFKKEFSPPKTIGKVFLGGASHVLPLVKDPASARLPYPLEVIDFKRDCPMETRFVKEGIPDDVSFSSGVGFLLGDGKRMDLIPPSEKKARETRMFRRSLAQCALWVVGLFVLLGAVFGSRLAEQRKMLHFLRKALHEFEPTATKIDTMQKQIALLKRREAESKGVLEILRELYRVAPQEVSLTYLAIGPDHISLRGTSKNFSTVFRFVKSLESSPFFESVRPKNATRRVLSEGEVTLFQIDASVAVFEGGEQE